MKDKPLLRPSQVAQVLNVSASYIYKLADDGLLPFVRFLFLIKVGRKQLKIEIYTALFKKIRQRQHLTSENVLVYQGRRIESVKTAFDAALRRAEIDDFRFHDLRHTFASHFAMRTGDLKALQEILGHADIKTTMRYAHLAKSHKKKRSIP